MTVDEVLKRIKLRIFSTAKAIHQLGDKKLKPKSYQTSYKTSQHLQLNNLSKTKIQTNCLNYQKLNDWIWKVTSQRIDPDQVATRPACPRRNDQFRGAHIFVNESIKIQKSVKSICTGSKVYYSLN